ncbi:MAG: XRE family transcriptional regulator [Candidatus Omnitrophota bacterium]|jgi:DNA-binding XRE family transcriptional regulator
MNFSQRIKELRGSIKQQEFAKRCHIDASTINKIEKGVLTGTLDIHIKICQALGITLSTLYKGVYEEKINPLTPALPFAELPLTYDQKITHQILAKNIFLNKKMLPEIITIESGSCFEERLTPDSQRFIFVLEGEIEISSNRNKYTLGQNQSIYITDTAILTCLKNEITTPARILCITTPAVL